MVNQALLDEYWLIFDRYARSIIKYIDYEAYYLANQEVFARDVYISKHFAYTKQLQDITIIKEIELEQTQKMAADFGYGLCKFMCNDKSLVTPTAIARARLSQANFENSSSYEFEGKNWLVGEPALRNTIPTRDYSFLETYAPLFLFEALHKFELDVTKPIQLSTGLSLSNWDKRSEFNTRLSDFVINKIRINNISTIFTPQGKGAYLSVLQKHPELRSKLVCIVDIGTYTLDVIWFEYGRALTSDSWASHHGTFIIIEELQKYIDSRFGITSSEAEVNKALQNNKISIAGDECDLSVFIENEKDSYLELIIKLVKNKNANLYKRAEAIIFAGGGATLCGKYLPEDKQFIIKCDDPQLANVNGYYSLLDQS